MTPPKGLKDERDALSPIRDVLAVQGAQPVQPPILQPLAPYLDLSGEDVRGRLYVVSAPDGEQYCLRPDLTIPVCRWHIETQIAPGAEQSGPITYRVEGPAFRFPPSGDGGAREFLQLGLERFGDHDAVAADCEMCALALEAVAAGDAAPSDTVLADASVFAAFGEALGVGPDLIGRLARRRGAPQTAQTPSHVATLLAGLSEKEAGAALAEFFRIAGVEPVGRRTPEAIAARLLAQSRDAAAETNNHEIRAWTDKLLKIDGPPRRALDAMAALCREAGVAMDTWLQAWAQRLDQLEANELFARTARLSIRFARHFNYYDGFVFEVRDEALGAAQVLAAGGRYDGLMERLGSPIPLNGVGVMARPERIAQSQRSAS